MLNVGVFGLHPEIKGGFNSAMTMSWIRGLTNCESVKKVKLYINDKYKCDTSTLSQWGRKFEIEFLAEGQDFDDDMDVIIWQTYYKEDHDKYWAKYKAGKYLKTKNYPRFFTGDVAKDSLRLSGALKAFDLVLFSLKEDFQKAIILDERESCAFVPRGFPARILNSNVEGDEFVVSVDVRKSKNITKDDYDIFIAAKEYFELKGLPIKFQALGKNIPGFKKVERSGVVGFYNNFINNANVYAFVDRTEKFQDSHVNSGGKTTYCGIYENTVVEAQLAGLMVIGPDKIIPDELLLDGYNGVRLADDRKTEDFARAVEYCYLHQKRLKSVIRNKAISNNSLNSMASMFIKAVERKIKLC
jgi:glycosyltransferase involved in cell wall biosynthesis